MTATFQRPWAVIQLDSALAKVGIRHSEYMFICDEPPLGLELGIGGHALAFGDGERVEVLGFHHNENKMNRSVAELCGAILPGDYVLAVNDEPIEANAKLEDTIQLLSESTYPLRI